MTITVKITNVLKETLQNDGINYQQFIDEFTKWKSQGSAGEFNSRYFGKDGAYVRPTVDGHQYALRHVHLIPLSDAVQLAKWNAQWKRKGKKISDRALVYVADHKGNYLLIFILPEPDAHRIAKMSNKEDRETMDGFAEVAAAFLENGEVLA